MNKIEKLLDNDYVLDFFNKKVLPLYPDFKKIKKIKIVSHKKFIWSNSYHVVLEFKVLFSFSASNLGKKKDSRLSFFCTAHSSERRKNVYDILKYLWANGFSKGFLAIPKPILYSKYFNASFYRGVNGDSLLKFIRAGDKKEIEKIVKKTAEWLAKLHKLPINEDLLFDKSKAKIKTVVPGYKKTLEDLKQRYDGRYYKDIKNIYDYLIDLEEDFFKLSDKRWLIHGDVHPENIIKISKNKMAMIDFTDMSPSDFARDLGSFLQQLEYKLKRNNYTKSYVKKIEDIFIVSYCNKAKVRYNARLKERVKLYYYWTAMRTAVYWLTKHEPDYSRLEPLIIEIKKKLKIT